MSAGGPVVVTGATGQLGSVMAAAFGDRETVGLTRADLDLTDPGAVRDTVADLDPALVVNCAAFNDVDGAEDDVAAAFAVNAFAVRSLARAADRAGAGLVHFSTDFVFDGRTGRPYVETDRPNPMSAYSQSKLAGEWFALAAARGWVLRVESLFGCPRDWAGRRGTLDTIVTRLEGGEEVRAFTDRVVTPSRITDVVAATRHLVEAGAPTGLYHCVNTGTATWYAVAIEAARLLGVTPRLTPITLDQVSFRAERPAYCALDNAKLVAAGAVMPTWAEALAGWLAAR